MFYYKAMQMGFMIKSALHVFYRRLRFCSIALQQSISVPISIPISMHCVPAFPNTQYTQRKGESPSIPLPEERRQKRRIRPDSKRASRCRSCCKDQKRRKKNSLAGITNQSITSESPAMSKTRPSGNSRRPYRPPCPRSWAPPWPSLHSSPSS